MKNACPLASTFRRLDVLDFCRESHVSRSHVFPRLFAWAAALAALLLTTSVSAQCSSPVPGGDPNKPGQCAGAGNPINVMTGNKYQREEDMPALPGVLGLEIVRHYNSAYSGPGHPNGVLGRGWRLSYETELLDRWGKIQVLQADGGRVIFDRDRNAPTGCSTPDPANGTMTIGRQHDGRPDYTWTWTDGRKLHFNAARKLDRITAPSGEVVRLIYDSQNVLVRVSDPQGRSLNLVYYDRTAANQFRGVRFIDTPVGRFAYEYGSNPPKGAELFDKRQLLATLVRVRLPDEFDVAKKAHPLSSRGTTLSKTSRIYHHEHARSPWLMTGISIETAGADGKPTTLRYSTYGYDDTGRAILSTHAGNVGKVTLDNSKPGVTVLTNSLGQKTIYRYAVIAGENRLLEVRGAGCAQCGEPNVRYRYDAIGRLTESDKLSEKGEPLVSTRTERDKLGRVSRISKFVHQNGKRGSAQLLVRYEYRGDSFTPTLVARPSVVTGEELTTQVALNEFGQPVSVTEAGWRPTSGNAKATRIERTVRYRYVMINGRSLLAEIDGPLPNGKTNTPRDSDITLIRYDNPGNLAKEPGRPPNSGRLAQFRTSTLPSSSVTAIITPGNRKSEVEYDTAGRITTVRDGNGRTTNLRYSPRGQLLAITRDGLVHSTLYDGWGRAVELGYSDGKRYQASTRLGYDDAGRNIWTASAVGVLHTRRFDTESQLLERATLSSAIRQIQRYDYDHLGRLQVMTDPGGATRRIGWNAMGLPDQLTDALGRTMRLGYDASGNITTVTDAVNATTRFELDIDGRTTAATLGNGATTRYVRDDFGRVVETIGADSGRTSRSFDAAGRLVASTDAKGNQATYEYDVMDRIVSQSVTDVGNGGEKTITTWRYEGKHLVAVDHPNQTERYSYDAKGRVSAKNVVLKLANGEHISSSKRYRYDALGQLSAITLPDGSTLEYRRNGQNQITSLERSTVGSSWLNRLLPRQTVVKNLERDVIGLRRITFGNGIDAHYQRSAEGRLARMVYRDPRLPALSAGGSAALEALLGVGSARAAAPSALPGALGLPADPKALLDHRYLWDAQGNLLYTRDKDAVSSYAFDARDRLIAAATAAPPEMKTTATGHNAAFARYHYDDNGNRLLAQEGLSDQSDLLGNTVKTSYAPNADHWRAETGDGGPTGARYDSTGQPERIGDRHFVWDAHGKLREVRDGRRILARYRYNHRGERIEKIVGDERTYYLYEDRKLIAELDEKGTIRRQYVYLADQPVAVIDRPHGGANSGSGGTAFTRHMSDIVAIWRAWFGTGETIVYLQNNHLGAVEMATDEKGKPVWQAAYSPFGKLTQPMAAATPGFELNLRLPGQYADKETGLYYNDHRYYDPDRGRYLTPDPIGLGGGANAYAYVNGNPMRYIDPDGLTLFAFDGTGNTNDQVWLTANGSSPSNVLLLLNLYDDGNKRYVSGVGTVHRDQKYGDIVPAAFKPGAVVLPAEEADMGGNYSGPARIQRMVQYFNDEADLSPDDGQMDVDIVGFSRGAAEARDFANRIIANTSNGWYQYKNAKGQQSCQKVNFRFMGLFDTVLSTNFTGTSYNLDISRQFAYVAHAVALNEHRGDIARRLFDSVGAFPLESIHGASNPIGKKRIERGFIGSHADVGGGFGPNESQLSQVALTWMVDQAKAAGVRIKDPTALRTIIANPVIHDKSDNQFSTNGAPVEPGVEDRMVNYRDGRTTNQMAMTGAGMTWADTQNYIAYLPAVRLDRGQIVRFPSGDYVTGKVDMRRYLAWLNQHGYNINMTVK